MIAKLNAFLQAVIAKILFFLPDSPFASFIDSLEKADWLHQLNWFVPVGTFFAIGLAWINAITVFYVYQVILRWAKVVAD